MSKRIKLQPLTSSRTPDARRYVGVCMTCRHWQADVRPGAVSDLGGSHLAIMAIAQAHADHLNECPGAGGRVKLNGQWVEAPLTSSGEQADGSMEFHPLPVWWVTR